MARTLDEIETLVAEWEMLRSEYASRGSTGIVDFISAELRKLRAEEDAIRAQMRETEPKPPA